MLCCGRLVVCLRFCACAPLRLCVQRLVRVRVHVHTDGRVGTHVLKHVLRALAVLSLA